ncbi:hypothetical protein FE257_005922 [Aspergillus nanangensis]|uniref:Uncharacterized protein n=1 Tax=Aspergillus nanangensis TaxID=2582783 RepID=A0AAD4GV69_ASPNN|nr:hypothetical protein FE257_005922 [Aspergillus nanangensis]
MSSIRVLMYLYLLGLLSTKVTANYGDDWATRPDTIRTSNAGPLTTTFVPPATCTDAHVQLKYDTPFWMQGCEGPNGNECCPDGWRVDVYFSPGVCPSGYRQCTLPTTRQRAETTNICCPSGFDCMGQDSCTKPYNTEFTITHTGATTTVEQTVYGITATPIQIRFKATDSTVVPVPTKSFELLKEGELTKRQKVGIGVGVPIAVAFFAGVGFLFYRSHPKIQYRRRRRDQQPQEAAPAGVSSTDDTLPSDPPPAYPGPPSESQLGK